MRQLKFPEILSLALVIISGCSESPSSQENNRLILKDGILNIPVIQGSKITKDCGSIGNSVENVDGYVCIEFPQTSEGVNGKDWDSDYSRELKKDGWKWAGGESIAFYFEKPIDEMCSHHLSMLGWFQATEEQEKIYYETGSLDDVENFVFIFIIDDELKCGDERNAE